MIPTRLFEENPILYLNSLEEIEQVLSHVELEKKIQILRLNHQVKARKLDLFPIWKRIMKRIRKRKGKG